MSGCLSNRHACHIRCRLIPAQVSVSDSLSLLCGSLSAISLHTELMDLQRRFASDTCWCHVHSMLALLGLDSWWPDRCEVHRLSLTTALLGGSCPGCEDHFSPIRDRS